MGLKNNFLFEQSLQLQYKLSQFIDLNIFIKSYKIVFLFFIFITSLHNCYCSNIAKHIINTHIIVNIKAIILTPLYISFNISKIKITIITKNIILTPH